MVLIRLMTSYFKSLYWIDASIMIKTRLLPTWTFLILLHKILWATHLLFVIQFDKICGSSLRMRANTSNICLFVLRFIYTLANPVAFKIQGTCRLLQETDGYTEFLMSLKNLLEKALGNKYTCFSLGNKHAFHDLKPLETIC